jgi:hypothetical protein
VAVRRCNSDTAVFQNDPNCGRLIAVYTLTAPNGGQTPDAPLAIGASVDWAFTEQRCLEQGQRGGTPRRAEVRGKHAYGAASSPSRASIPA